jgi:uncharacterized iron-regulated membrane protein
MTEMRAAKLRRLWLNVHLWLGVGLVALLIPISMSGALLVWHDEIDNRINPARYAVTDAQVAQPPSVYLARAVEAVAGDAGAPRAAMLRLSEPGSPVRVMMRGQARDAGARPRIVTVFLDPPTATVLDVVELRTSFVGFLHMVHENLTIPDRNGRQIVGWAGAGLLILSLTGIWLWWPRSGNVLHGLRWARSPFFTVNLHHLLGFWFSLPLAAVSATGIYLSFPQTAREAMSAVTPMNPQLERGSFGGQTAQQTRLTADQAAEIALKAEPGARLIALFLPVQRRTERDLAWRAQLTRGEDNMLTVLVDDRSGQPAPAILPLAGDRAAAWIRWIHEGSHAGRLWSAVVFLAGAFPSIFAVTGIVMWLRKRSRRRAADGPRPAEQLRPAE